MKKYNISDFDNMVQPLIEFLREEYPKNCKIIITNSAAELIYEHIEAMSLYKNPLLPQLSAEQLGNMNGKINEFFDSFKTAYQSTFGDEIKKQQESEEQENG